MKILHFTYTALGGAGIAALRQHKALKAAGIDSTFLTVTGKADPAYSVYSLEQSLSDYPQLHKQFTRRKYFQNLKTRWHGKTPELFSSTFAPWNIENHPLIKQADIIHLHWIAGMIDPAKFFACVNKPIVWTLHDAWPFTGGFHYEKYWNSESFSGYSAAGLKIRKKAYAGRNINLVFPSLYLLELCRKSAVFADARYHHIDNCVDEKYSSIIPDENNLSQDGLKFLYASGELNYFRKGFDIAKNAYCTGGLSKHKLRVLGISKINPDTSEAAIDYMGYTLSADELISHYKNADFLIHTSREDNQPNVIAEALCCGVPVVATPAGGVAEMITSGENGVLLDDFSSETLRDCISRIHELKFDRALIAKNAQRKYAPARFVQSIMEVYSGL